MVCSRTQILVRRIWGLYEHVAEIQEIKVRLSVCEVGYIGLQLHTDISEVNPRLYEHVAEIQEIKVSVSGTRTIAALSLGLKRSQ